MSRRQMPQPILHANDGVVATGHPILTRKRGAVVLLAAITFGAGMTAYGVYAASGNCQQDPNDTSSCNHTSTHSSFVGSRWSHGSTTTGPSEPSASRGGFGAHGASHASAAS